MAVWCLSGVVMMYVPYPRLTDEQRLAALPPLDWQGCCHFGDGNSAAPARAPISDTAAVPSLQVEMLGERPVLRAIFAGVGRKVIDLRTGDAIDSVPDKDAGEVASQFAEIVERGGRRATPKLILRDQWTVAAGQSRAAVLRVRFRRSVADRGVRVERDRQGGSGDAILATVLELAGIGAALAVSHRASPVSGGGLRWWSGLPVIGHLPHGDRAVPRDQGTASTRERQAVVPSSRAHVVAPRAGARLRRARADVGGERPVLDEPVGNDGDRERCRRLRTVITGEPPRWSDVRGLIESVSANAPSNMRSLNAASFGGEAGGGGHACGRITRATRSRRGCKAPHGSRLERAEIAASSHARSQHLECCCAKKTPITTAPGRTQPPCRSFESWAKASRKSATTSIRSRAGC